MHLAARFAKNYVKEIGHSQNAMLDLRMIPYCKRNFGGNNALHCYYVPNIVIPNIAIQHHLTLSFDIVQVSTDACNAGAK